MSGTPEQLIDRRLPTPAELAELIKAMRQMNKWSQATLAELARITERTLQRVENGEPSSLDTRRAIARALGYEDLDIFEKPWPFPNVERLKAYTAELDKTTAIIPIIRIWDGRTLRTMVEGSEAFATEEIGELSSEAREAFAAIVDYLRDYNDVCDLYSVAQRLYVDREIEELLKKIADERAIVGAGLRHARVRFKTDSPNCKPMDWTNIYFVLAPEDALPSTVRVPKAFKFS
jgi:transcriptional regulator with XRE-family HTH domain